MTTAGASPSSSPRLPSPPPFAEDQLGPLSPVGNKYSSSDKIQSLAPREDDGTTRRIRPGTKAADMAFGPPLIPLSQLDSPFQLQEHLKALYHHFTKPEGSETVIPINRKVASQLAEPPEGIDRSLWLYELCRFLTMKVNNLIIAFFAESPPCSSNTCPEMRASEWQYLCAVHDPPKSCCAIDYCCHTLDWANNTLTSPKYFPSRLTLGSEAGGGPQTSMRHLTNIFRRLYRIFAHAWFQHRDVFWEVEGHDGLYVFFKTVCDMYSLIPEDNYTIPIEAEGPDAVIPQVEEPVESKRLTILRKDNENPFADVEGLDPSLGIGATTRRHKHSPSTGSHITTITESAEDSEDPVNGPAPSIVLPRSPPSTVAEHHEHEQAPAMQRDADQVTVPFGHLEDTEQVDQSAEPEDNTVQPEEPVTEEMKAEEEMDEEVHEVAGEPEDLNESLVDAPNDEEVEEKAEAAEAPLDAPVDTPVDTPIDVPVEESEQPVETVEEPAEKPLEGKDVTSSVDQDGQVSA